MINFFMNTTALAVVLSQVFIANIHLAEGVSSERYIQVNRTNKKLLHIIDESKNIAPGSISIKYEIGNKDGSYISSGNGDAGGKSYGISQFTSKSDGSANSFVEWICQENPSYATFFLNSDKAGTDSFDKAWKDAFNFNPTEFTDYQREFTMNFYVRPFMTEFKEEVGVDFNSSLALQESAYSLAVQFGKNGALTIARNSGIDKFSSEEEIIKLLYSEKRNCVGNYKFLKCSQDVQVSVYNRFINEEQDILDIYQNNPCNSLVNYNITLESF